MKMYWWNKNLFGTHFGGSLASMTDPFYIFSLSQEQIDTIRTEVEEVGKKDFAPPVKIINKEGGIVCELEKTIYVKKEVNIGSPLCKSQST